VEGSKQKGLTLVELSVVSSLLALFTVFVGTTANTTYHQYKRNAIMIEFQNIVNINYIKTQYEVDIENIAPVATKDFTITNKSDVKYSSFESIIPAGGGLPEEPVTFYSQQTDPLVDLYLIDPFASKRLSR